MPNRPREHDPTERRSLIPFPFDLPNAFLPRLGYRGGHRLVGLSWEPAGDELVTDDGLTRVCGADGYPSLGLVQRPEVAAWLGEQGLDLGSSDGPATDWRLVDQAAARLRQPGAGRTREGPDPAAR